MKRSRSACENIMSHTCMYVKYKEMHYHNNGQTFQLIIENSWHDFTDTCTHTHTQHTNPIQRTCKHVRTYIPHTIQRYNNNIEHSLKQSCFSQVLGNDNVCDRLKHKLYVTCVCGTCDVGVDRLTTGVSVQTNKLVSDEIHSILVSVSSYI